MTAPPTPDLARQVFGDDVPAKRLALIVDLDDTVCTGFACPLRAAVEVLLRVHRQRVEVHYVTARTDVSRDGTDAFIAEHKLPGYRNVHYCPKWHGTKRHKAELHAKLAREYRVIASVGDTDQEEGEAARGAGVPFVLVDRNDPAPAWAAVAARIEAVRGFRDGDAP
jgi:phosphoglycolate phosphatase-like HAD superfamily hydrolase